MYGMQSKINQILRGAETIRRNSMSTDTPRIDTCPDCGAFLLTHHTQAYCLERTARQKAEAEVERLTTLMHQTIWFVDDMIKTHTNGCEHCLKKHGAMIALFKDITEEPQWPIDPTDK